MKLFVCTPDGNEEILDAEEGNSVMETIRDAGLDIMAICGGSCSCGTCHVHVDPKQMDRLPPRSEEEAELVSNSPHYDSAVSRLGCQIKCHPALDGLKVSLQEDAWCG